MELKDLKTGMVVELRNGDKYLVINQDGKLNGIRENSYITFNSKHAHKSDMTWPNDSSLDVVKVFRPILAGFEIMLKNKRNCIWTRDRLGTFKCLQWQSTAVQRRDTKSS